MFKNKIQFTDFVWLKESKYINRGVNIDQDGDTDRQYLLKQTNIIDIQP